MRKKSGAGKAWMEVLERRQLLSAAIQALASTVIEGSDSAQVQASANFVPTYEVLGAAEALAPLGTAGAQGYTPSELRAAYGLNQVSFGGVAGDGTGQTIAIIDAYNAPTIAADLHAFSAAFGLPDASLRVVAQDGSSNLPGADPAGAGSLNWEGEEALDVQWAHAMAPGAAIILVEAKDASPSNLFAAVNWARQQAGVSVISMSFGGNETASETQYDAIFTTPSGHGGVTFVASSGDSGTPAGYPAYSPNVVAVGGTSLAIDAVGNYQSETAWSGSGGGVSTVEGKPSYQSGAGTPSGTLRSAPDVAFDADPSTGVAVFDSYNNGTATPWEVIGGTSLSAPAWAGIIAVANQGRLLAGEGTLDGRTGTLPLLYAAPAADFHDVTTGNNGSAASAGYDVVTGRGSPRANVLVPYLVSGTVTTPPPTNGPAIASVSASALTVTEGASLTLTANGVSDAGGTGLVVTFYEESNGVAGLQTDATSGDFAFTAVTDGSNAITLDTSNAVGTFTFYAQLTDAAGGASAAGAAAPSVTVTVTAPSNGGPAVAGVSATPNPVVTGNTVTLAAQGISDALASVRRVYFYEETNGVSGLQTGVGGDFAFRPTSAASGFSLALDTTGVTGAVTFYALATDFLGNVSATGAAAPKVDVLISSGLPPAAPTNLTARAVSATEIDLAYAEAGGTQTGFSIERATDAAFTNVTHVFSINRADSLTYSDTGLTPNTTYYYRVQANNEAGSSGYSNVASATTSTISTFLIERDPSGLGATTYQFQIEVSDSVAVNAATLMTNSLVTVRGPNGFSAAASFVAIDSPANGNVRTATYQIVLPGGGWNAGDEGAFTVSVAANAITDINGNAVIGGAVGTFYYSQNPLFSERYYLTHNADVAEAVAAGTFASGYQHYLAFGQLEGRNPSAYFDEAFYDAKYADVRAAVAGHQYRSGFDHFVQKGAREGRQPSLLFDPAYYLAVNADVAAAVAAGTVGSALEHFMEAGQYEERDPSVYFSTNYYLGHNADIAAAVANGTVVSALDHFVERGLAEGRSGVAAFDENFYLAHNADVAAAVAGGVFSSGYAHYLTNGQFEVFRQPSATFDPEYYLGHNADVAAAVNAGEIPSAFYHYLRWGRLEGRAAHA